ncbi:ion channel CASTOR-like isoform X2 [Syzygium oleosum]|uniref:ion channel CASTOR-like isoform X2 n=1 Tax=Syzygium oleosum TaxID=219896 RepID=UPI0024B891CC|nr:ion channel CASTOR-like isoform X2 [Syzygium oleosum]
MSHADPDASSSSSASFGRDWFFPSPSPYCVHPSSSAASAAKTPKYPRRFSTNPRSYSSSFSLDSKPPPKPPPHSFRSAPPVSSAPYREARYAGARRRLGGPALRPETSPAGGERKAASSRDGGAGWGAGSDRKPEAPAERVPSRGKGIGDLRGRLRLRLRWRMAFLVAIALTAFSSVVHKNFSLRSQVEDLQGQISQLRITLQACSLLDLADVEGSIDDQNQDGPNKRLKNIALISSLSVLCLPILLLKCIDKVPRSRSSDGILEEVSLSKQLAYRLDVSFSVHPYAKPLALLVATLLLICLGGLALFGVTDDGIADCLWLSWTYVASAGNHADSEGIGPRFVSVSISFGGMLIFAMMLGLVSDAISEKFDSLRKGRSEVVEQNHTLVLGWSDKLGSLLNQLALANESLGGGTIVVMAERDKEEMELDIAKMEFDFKGTSVICRSGSPLILADLKKVSVSKARAIVVLAVDGNADQSDARALRTVLSLTGVKEGLRGHIVVELSDLDNEILVKLVGGDLVETVVAHDVIGRLMIQCARQPGLAQIWEDILGFENCEFYIKRWPQLDGVQFEDVLISFPDAIPCGIKVASCGGKIILNPDDSYVLQEGDEVLVIAEDDDTYAPAALPMVWRGHVPKDFGIDQSSEKILFCGWRRDMEDMIMVLDASLAPESELWMFNEVPEKEREKKLIDGGLDINRLANIKLENREGNAVIRRHLESLPLETFDSILILADESVEDSAIQADSRSLATLLLIRDIQAKRLPYSVAPSRRGNFSQGSWMGEMQQASDKSVIISEILDPRTKNLLSMSKISDYVLSNELVSMALAMVAEDRQINDVLEELFAEEGNEMHIRPADLYLREGEELSFYELLLRARLRREIIIGYRLANAEKAVINPPAKDERQTWSVKDVFVVIAEKE